MTKILGTQYTIEFVVDELKRYFKIDDAKLQSHTEKRIGQGEGFCSIIARLALRWENDADGKLPKGVILKVPTMETMSAMLDNNESMKEYMKDENVKQEFRDFFIQMHNNECYFYEYIGNNTANLAITKVYSWKKMDNLEDPGFLLMEDLGVIGGALINNADGLNLEQVKEIVQNHARFNAYVLKQEDKSWQKYVAVPKQSIDNFKKSQEYGLKPMQGYDPERFTDEFLKKLDYMWNQEYIKQIYSPADTKGTIGLPLGLVHGDLWTNNMIFRDGHLLSILDWQTLHPGNFAEDLCRLLVSSCPPEFIKNHLDEILEFYHETCQKEYGSELNFKVSDLNTAFNFAMPFSTFFYTMSVAFIGDSPAIVGPKDDPKREARRKSLADRAYEAILYCDRDEIKSNFENIIAKCTAN